MLVRIATTNDASGNPRRGWLRLTAGGQVIGWTEEGYLGRGAIEGYDDGESPTIYVKPSEPALTQKYTSSPHTPLEPHPASNQGLPVFSNTSLRIITAPNPTAVTSSISVVSPMKPFREM